MPADRSARHSIRATSSTALVRRTCAVAFVGSISAGEWRGTGDARQPFPDPLSWEHNLRVAKPWRCRLRLHDWDDRENPETHEYYQVCLRCNAYRERGRAAAGITAGAWYASPATHVGYELIGAGMLIVAGGGHGLPLDYDDLERWTRVGYQRGMRSRKGER
jgi:hypothetical protein